MSQSNTLTAAQWGLPNLAETGKPVLLLITIVPSYIWDEYLGMMNGLF